MEITFRELAISRRESKKATVDNSLIRAPSSAIKGAGYTLAAVGRGLTGDFEKAKQNKQLAVKKFKNATIKHSGAKVVESFNKNIVKESGKAFEDVKKDFYKGGDHLLRAGVEVMAAPKNLMQNIADSWEESKTKNLKREFGEATGIISNKEAMNREAQRRRFNRELKSSMQDIKEMNLSEKEKMEKLEEMMKEKFKGMDAKIERNIANNARKYAHKMSIEGEGEGDTTYRSIKKSVKRTVKSIKEVELSSVRKAIIKTPEMAKGRLSSLVEEESKH